MNTISFDKEKTQLLKGIALIMMIIHHSSTPIYWAEEESSLFQLLEHLVLSTKMCVYIFAFLVGYGFYCSKNKTIQYSCKRIFLVLIPFWTMLACMFIPAAYFSNNLDTALKYNENDWVIELIYNMFGLSESLNWYSWFVGFYCISILMMPFLYKSMEKYKYAWIIIILGYYIAAAGIHTIPEWNKIPFTNILFTTCRLIPLIIVGYMCGVWNRKGIIPQWFEGKNKLLLSLIAIIIIMLINAFRYPVAGFCIQAFYTPILIFAIIGIFNSYEVKWLNKVLIKVGNLSMYMWFFHAIFFTETVNLYTKHLVFEPINNYFYTLIMTLLLTYVGSYIIQKIISPITKLIK